MAISWNEIRARALAFSKEWAKECSEDAEAKSFWDAFFAVFGVNRRRVAAFEKPVKKGDGKGGFIDLLWPGVLLVEHKSRGKDLDKAVHQALEYFPGLKEHQLPRFVLVSDFARFRLYDLDDDKHYEFALHDLHKHIRKFGFIAGYETRDFGIEDPVNVRAVEALGKLHDQLKASGYAGEALEVLLVRLLFCLFAEDTSIFEQRYFSDWIERHTAEDGSNLGPMLGLLFQVLDTPHEKRHKNLDESMLGFPYVNGKLFSAVLPVASFDAQMRITLLDCGALNWSRISPAIFGSLFQSVMDAEARRELGAHYTTETNILKLLRPLFLDQLQAEFERVRHNQKQLQLFHGKLTRIRVLDPACGCGNFLVIAYRELRLLELEVLRTMEHLRASQHIGFELSDLVQVDVDQFYGIEYEEFPAQIAQVALWLTDHQLNLKVSEEFGDYFIRLPLRKAPTIMHGNALTVDWADLVPPDACSYIVGNPPFVGKKEQSSQQKNEVLQVHQGVRGAGVLDYVSCWYRRAAEYMTKNPAIQAAFVSTNSIVQGEQVGVLWPALHRLGVCIRFAHRPFQWSSEARGRAAVHCVIIGFDLTNNGPKLLYDYETPKSDPHLRGVSQLNGYLVDAPPVALIKRSAPICAGVPAMAYGSMPIDDGNLALTEEEANTLRAECPEGAPYIRPYIGGDEFLNGLKRYCLWLPECPAKLLSQWPGALRRVEANRRYRQSSSRPQTIELAQRPAVFGEIRQPETRYLFVPKVSSENRQYLPVGYVEPEVIASGSGLVVAGASLYHFGVLQSGMHMAWMRAVCGRLESRYQYSAGIVYNNFPWPEPNLKQRQAIEAAASKILHARALQGDSTLAELYNPLTMPAALLDAHRALDRAVDAAFGRRMYASESDRVAFLLQRYEELTSILPTTPSRGRRAA